MRYKSEVFSTFKKFPVYGSVAEWIQVKKLRSERGDEYTSLEFKNLCENIVLERKLTVAYTPQQNIVAEGKIEP